MEERLYYVNRIKLNRIESNGNSSICWEFNKISLQLSSSLFRKCHFLYFPFSHQPSLLCFNSTLFHSLTLALSLSLSLRSLYHHKNKIEIQKSSGWVFAICRSRNLTKDKHFTLSTHTQSRTHTMMCEIRRRRTTTPKQHQIVRLNYAK